MTTRLEGQKSADGRLLGLFDTHCHLMTAGLIMTVKHDYGLLLNGAFDADGGQRFGVLSAVQQAGGAVSHAYASAGIIRTSRPGAGRLLDEVATLAQPGVVAVGEIGLDYHYNHSPRDRQMQVLNEQLDLAYALKRPAIIHVREAHGDMLSVLRARKGCCAGGIIHCFSGSVESAEEYVSLGYYISFAGPVTFANAMKLRAVAASVPLDRLLIETDSPYLTPVPFRGKRNEPRYVRLVCDDWLRCARQQRHR